MLASRQITCSTKEGVKQTILPILSSADASRSLENFWALCPRCICYWCSTELRKCMLQGSTSSFSQIILFFFHTQLLYHFTLSLALSFIFTPLFFFFFYTILLLYRVICRCGDYFGRIWQCRVCRWRWNHGYPQGLAIDQHGNLYVADYNRNNIRKITSMCYLHVHIQILFVDYACWRRNRAVKYNPYFHIAMHTYAYKTFTFIACLLSFCIDPPI
jgi:hypothetical protein